MNIPEIWRSHSRTIFASGTAADAFDDFVLVEDIGILLLAAVNTFETLAFGRHRKVVIILVGTFLLLAVHAPPALAFSFHPKMVLVPLFSATNLTDAASASCLPNMVILK